MKNIYKYFLIPLIVGLIIAGIQFGLPYFFGDKKELTYKIYEPITYFDKNTVGELNIVINGIESNALFSNQFLIENTGQIPLKNIPITIKFDTLDSLFKIYNYTIQTQPPLEFGNIDKKLSRTNLSINVDLINPKDKILINILTNSRNKSGLYSKSEGMILSKAEIKEEKKEDKFSFLLALLASIMSTILSFFISPKTLNALGALSKVIDNLFKAKNQSGLKVVSALYGNNETYIDITEKLNQLIENDKLSVKVSNELAGRDPLQNVKKELKLIYSLGSKIETVVVDETQDLKLPIDEKNAT
ncbi:MAG TPA: hypothetical protein DCR40_09120 [Prolixibacteraceae bacterium]|nr:hypothetical protein [Prolixibacteraceae bacterium]